MEQRVVKIDLLDYLFSNVGIFCQLDVAGKRKIFASRPQPVFDVVLDIINDKKYVTPFDPKYYTDFPWMTACPKRKVLFCFVCLLQGKTVESVICTRSDVVAAAHAHEMSSSHMSCHDACLRSVANPPSKTPQKDKRQFITRKKKSILKKLIQTLYLLKCQTYFDKIGRGWEFSLKTVDFMALNDISFSLDWETHFPGIVSDPKQSHFAILRNLVMEHIKGELSQCDFVSMQMEDVSEYVAEPAISVSFRFIINDEIRVRFAGFYKLSDYGIKIDNDILPDVLSYWDIGHKLIGISSDFHIKRLPIIFSGRPFVFFNLSSTNHHMNYVFVKIASVHKEIREFLGQIQAIVSFVNEVRDERYGDLANPLDSLPHDELIDVQISLIHTHLKGLCDYLSLLKKNPQYSLHKFRMTEIETILRDSNFLFYTDFFSKFFEIGKDMTNYLTQSSDESVSAGKVGILKRLQSLSGSLGIGETGQSTSESKKKPVSLDQNALLTQKIIDSALKDFDLRDKNQSNFAIARLFNMNNKKQKAQDTAILIRSNLEAVLVETKGLLDFNLPRLKIELQNVFRDPSKSLPPDELFSSMVSAGTVTVFPEFTKLLRFYLTFPISSVQDIAQDRTYNRIKTFARTAKSLGSLPDFDYLFIESDLTLKLLGDQDFTNYLITQLSKTLALTDLLSENDV